jgi:hypothetical protein
VPQHLRVGPVAVGAELGQLVQVPGLLVDGDGERRQLAEEVLLGLGGREAVHRAAGGHAARVEADDIEPGKHLAGPEPVGVAYQR